MDSVRSNDSCSADFREDNPPNTHIPVLCSELQSCLDYPQDATLVDATTGFGGHSLLLGRRLKSEGLLVGLDVDPMCLTEARQRLAGLDCRVVLVRENFALLSEVLAGQNIKKVDVILADLGFCSAQLLENKRGLSFQSDMPLDMRLDDRLERSAADLVNQLDEKSLADVLYNYGQERASRRIARFIVSERSKVKISTTGQIAAIVCRAFGRPAKGRKSKIHPATRTFQALRIAVNDELGNLQALLKAAPALLKPGGYIAVISFHSLEDGIVKWDFRSNAAAGIYELVTKKPIVACREEIRSNPRSRSAKLRIAKRKENDAKGDD